MLGKGAYGGMQPKLSALSAIFLLGSRSGAGKISGMKIKHVAAGIAVFIILVTAVADLAHAFRAQPELTDKVRQRVLRIFNWHDYIDPQVLVDFSRATGVAPLYNEYDDNAILDARLQRGTADFDVVAPSATPYMARQIEQGLLRPLDKNLIPNFKNQDPQLLALVQKADPENKHGIIYQWGTTGILYNPALVQKVAPQAPVESLEIVFNLRYMEKLQQCGVAMLDSPSEIVPLALHYLGYNPDSNNAAELLAAETLLRNVRPYIKYFHSSRYVQDLADGNLCVVLGWNGDANLANAQAAEQKTSVKIAYAVPQEGTVVWFDMMAIPKNAPNVQAAHAFMNYVLEPQVMARISNVTGFANAVPASAPFMQPEVLGNGIAYPTGPTKQKLFALSRKSAEDLRALQQLWSRMRTSHVVATPAGHEQGAGVGAEKPARQQ